MIVSLREFFLVNNLRQAIESGDLKDIKQAREIIREIKLLQLEIKAIPNDAQMLQLLECMHSAKKKELKSIEQLISQAQMIESTKEE
ncbi:hypothetical protein [Algibacillus agarilyticus]|uniref:hypothetical protein n=1 Tax=Algibacillus agarilyticus TaxID=2234133 RepID=UPI000DD0CD3D|nr:hypothetical protein [Algibacillus agarilyticus]